MEVWFIDSHLDSFVGIILYTLVVVGIIMRKTMGTSTRLWVVYMTLCLIPYLGDLSADRIPKDNEVPFEANRLTQVDQPSHVFENFTFSSLSPLGAPLILFDPLLILIHWQSKMKKERSVSSFFLLLFLSQGCVAQIPAPTTTLMRTIWETFGVSSSELEGSEICNFPGVNCSNSTYPKGIKLNNHQLNGSISTDICQLVNLTQLNLNSNKLSGAIPECIGNLTSLTYLDLGNNHLNGNIPDGICILKNLFWLNLGTNILTGQIPLGINDLTLLTDLYMDTNNLSGHLPSFGSLGVLENFRVGYNRALSGTISDTNICNLTNLIFLDFSTMNLNGIIPDCADNLSNLKGLYLDSNHLNGTIPEGVINLPCLTELYLSHNTLSGRVAGRNSSLHPLNSLYLSDNDLDSMGFINVSKSCDLTGNHFLCSSNLTLGLCIANISSCLISFDGLYDAAINISIEQAQVFLDKASRADTAKSLSAVLLALLHNTTSFDYNSSDVSVNLYTYNQSSLNTKLVLQSNIIGMSVAISCISYDPFLINET
ncbi:hypothetical protein PROFUN_16263, partial [Planoprotostelium fungivorum]